MSGKVCTAPEMIPAPRQIDPEMIPIMPHFLSRRPRNDPQLILGMERYPRTMDRAKCTIIFTCPHSLMTLILAYTLVTGLNENII